MQFQKKIHYDFINAVKKIDAKNLSPGYETAVDDFFAKYPLQECREVLMAFLTKLYPGNYEWANELMIDAYMSQIYQMLNPDQPQEEGGKDQP